MRRQSRQHPQRQARRQARRLAAAAVLLAASALPALAADCAPSTSVRYGETAEQIAQRCGINVEKLKAANPGMIDGTTKNGTFIQVPRPDLPSPKITIGGNRGIVVPRAPSPAILQPTGS